RPDRHTGREQCQRAVGSLDRKRLVPAHPKRLAGISRAGRRRAVAGRVRGGAADLRQRAEPLHVHRLLQLGSRDARVRQSARARHRRRLHLSQSADDHLRPGPASVTLTGALAMTLRRLLPSVLLGGTLAGCTNLDLKDPNEPSTDTFWRTAADAVAGVNAVYNGLQNNGTYGRWLVFA